MAVIQISKIQVRRGLEENLPQLAAGEFGWSTDTRRLFIGNGVLGDPDYAPEIGNTEILTVYSNNELAISINDILGQLANLSANVNTIQTTLANATITTFTLTDNTPTPANIGVTIQTLNSVAIDYSISRGTSLRVGKLNVTQFNGTPVYDDEYSETASTGVSLGLTSYGTNVELTYTTTSTSTDGQLAYFIKRFE